MKKTIFALILIPLLLLAAAFALDPIARANTQSEHVWLMQTLLPGADEFVRVEYAGTDESIRSVHQADEGFVVEVATDGYADEVVMLVGVSNDGRVTGLVVSDAHETLGLGSRILTDHEFLAQFLNESASFTVDTGAVDAFSGATAESTGGDELAVDAISGATVSSKAVARCVSAAVAYVTGADVGSSATSWGG